MFGMETAEVLRDASYISFGLAALFFILTILLFFRYKIRSLIYELSGKARQASTEKMKADYAFSGTLRQTAVPSGEVRQKQMQGLFNTYQLVTAQPEADAASAETGVMRPKAKPGSSGRIGRKPKQTFSITKSMIEIHTDESIS